MNAETIFCNEISKLKRSVFVRALQQTFLIAFLFFSGTCAIVLIIEKSGYLISRAYGWIYTPLFGLCLGVGLLITFLKKKKFLDFLIDSDTRLQLKDRLSTAYEYQGSGKKSDLKDLLMKDATRTLRQLGKRKLLPLKLSYHHFLLVLLIVINIALYASDYFWSGTQSTLISRSRLDQIDSLIRDYTENRIEGQKRKKSRSPNNYTSELKKLRRKLQQGDIPRDQLITSLHRFLKAIQGNQAGLANTVGAQLTAAKIEEMPVLNIPTLQNLSASQLQQLKMLLSQVPDTPVFLIPFTGILKSSSNCKDWKSFCPKS
jgi:hypothetical protein